MKTLRVSMSDQVALRVVAAVCDNNRYQEVVASPDPEVPGNIPNPETKAQFVNRMVREYLKQQVKAYEQRLAEQAIVVNDIELTDAD